MNIEEERISLIVPAINEEEQFSKLVQHLNQVVNGDSRLIEKILVDGGSQDATKKIAEKHGFKVIPCAVCRRSSQMNLGAQQAQGNILHFVHADVLPPQSFISDITDALKNGADFGCFSYRFDKESKLLGFNSKRTRKPSKFIGGGDQTLFIKKEVFDNLKGFREDHKIMEDFELYWRADKTYRSKIIQNDALVSGRKYDGRSYFQVQFANSIVFMGYRLGMKQERLVRLYKWLLRK